MGSHLGVETLMAVLPHLKNKEQKTIVIIRFSICWICVAEVENDAVPWLNLVG